MNRFSLPPRQRRCWARVSNVLFFETVRGDKHASEIRLGPVMFPDGILYQRIHWIKNCIVTSGKENLNKHSWPAYTGNKACFSSTLEIWGIKKLTEKYCFWWMSWSKRETWKDSFNQWTRKKKSRCTASFTFFVGRENYLYRFHLKKKKCTCINFAGEYRMDQSVRPTEAVR